MCGCRTFRQRSWPPTTGVGPPEGTTEERAGGANTYNAPHLRYRDYFADMRVTVALRLDPDGETPTLDALADALQEPARPLFIGRKPCLPSAPLFAGSKEGDTALDALLAWPLAEGSDTSRPLRLLWPEGEGAAGIEANRRYMITDQRQWVSGLHGGGAGGLRRRRGAGPASASLSPGDPNAPEKDVQK